MNLDELIEDLEHKGAAIGITLRTIRELYQFPANGDAVSVAELPAPPRRALCGVYP